MNKVGIAIFVAVIAVTLIEFSAARRGGDHGSRERNRKPKNCSTSDNLQTNLRCAYQCYTSSNSSQWGNCQNGTCACYPRVPASNNGTTNSTTGRRSILLEEELPNAPDGKKHNLLIGRSIALGIKLPNAPDGKKHNLLIGRSIPSEMNAPDGKKKHNLLIGRSIALGIKLPNAPDGKKHNILIG